MSTPFNYQWLSPRAAVPVDIETTKNLESYEDKRRTQSLDNRRARIYQRISEVWDQLPDEFKPSELYLLTGIKNNFANRILVASVLADSFGCTIVNDYTPRRRWKKLLK